MNGQLVILLEKALGSGLLLKDNQQIKFYCPFCHHHKQKLEVCIDESQTNYQHWNCWVCGNQGNKGKTIYSLFKKLNVSQTLLDQAKEFLPNKKIIKTDLSELKPTLILPEEFIPLSIIPKKKSIEFKNAYHYITKIRKISHDEIIRYNIGYCEDGKYNKCIIIPSYDCNNQLNYFTGRTYYDDADGLKYTNPNISRDIIGFENMIQWNYPIILVEGVFDAIAVRRNAIPLFGKQVLNELKKKIVTNKITDLYIALDNDAIKDMIPLIQYFMGIGINVYYVSMPEKDASEMGYKKFIKLINNIHTPCTFKDIMKLKML